MDIKNSRTRVRSVWKFSVHLLQLLLECLMFDGPTLPSWSKYASLFAQLLAMDELERFRGDTPVSSTPTKIYVSKILGNKLWLNMSLLAYCRVEHFSCRYGRCWSLLSKSSLCCWGVWKAIYFADLRSISTSKIESVPTQTRSPCFMEVDVT